jgi:hypothetical protein
VMRSFVMLTPVLGQYRRYILVSLCAAALCAVAAAAGARDELVRVMESAAVLQRMPADAVLAAAAAAFPQAPLMKIPTAGQHGGAASPLPIVILHGMGDSCFNSGMESLTSAVAAQFNTYAVCIPGGPDAASDTLATFLIDMNANIDNLNAAIAADPKLAGGFNAIGLSQGNLMIRGYMQRYNAPVVANHLSIHGPLAGVAGIPMCALPGNSFCQLISDVLGDLAYNSLMQGILFQVRACVCVCACA